MIDIGAHAVRTAADRLHQACTVHVGAIPAALSEAYAPALAESAGDEETGLLDLLDRADSRRTRS